MSVTCLKRGYGLDQEVGSLATVADIRYLGFLICVDFAYSPCTCQFLLFFHFPEEGQFMHIVKCLSIGAKNTVQRKKNYSIMKC